MKVLIFGPSGSGKTYLSKAFKSKGVNAFDADEIDGLWAWYDKGGSKVAAPQNAAEALQNEYSFLWSRKILKRFLAGFEEIYLFGGSGNIFKVMDLFDKVFFLQVDAVTQEERLRSRHRKDPEMDFDDEQLVSWGSWFEEQAKNEKIAFIDATQTAEEIFKIVSG